MSFSVSLCELDAFDQLVESRKIDPLQINEFRLKNTLGTFGATWKAGYTSEYRNALMKSTDPFISVRELLSTVHKQAKIGVITNAHDGNEQWVAQAGLSDHLDSVIVAGEIGVFKPEPAIFAHALTQLGVRADEAIFVSDSENMTSAEQIWPACRQFFCVDVGKTRLQLPTM